MIKKVNVLDVAKWFYEKHSDIDRSFDGHLKLQKLLYYTQVMSLSIQEHSVFDNKIEAWEHGPVVRALYNTYKYSTDSIENRNSITFDEETEHLLNVVNSLYGFKTGKELEHITHTEMPWLELKDEIDKRLNPEITQDRIKNYYKKMKNLYEGFSDFDFENEKAEYINNNAFVYNFEDTQLEMEDREILYEISKDTQYESFYVYKELGELVVY